MKKLFLCAIAAVAMFSFVSCQSVEDKAKQYLKEIDEAYKAGDEEKAEKLEEEYAEWLEGLSKEEIAELAKLN